MKQTEKTGLTVSRILEAAALEFGRNGYAGGTVNNICKSGINKGQGRALSGLPEARLRKAARSDRGKRRRHGAAAIYEDPNAFFRGIPGGSAYLF